MPIVTAKPLSTTIVAASTRTISTLGGSLKVTDFENQPAEGRKIIVLGKSVLGGLHEIKAQTVTDANGDYSVTLNAGPNDRFVVVAVGDPNHDEYTRALGDITGVV